MPIDSGNLALKGLDDLFSTEENRQEEQREQVQQIPIDELHPFTNHPFKVLDDEAMTRTVESIAQYGVLAPLIARPRPDGDGYEIISGHRRQYAAKLAGLDTLPVIVRQMSDDAAVILMVDSNLQREHILPSERALAYKMKLDAIKNQGARSDLTSRQVVGKLEAADEVGKATDESGRQVQRFIRLTNLVPELLDMVDEKKISFNPAVELSYLDAKQQQDFLEAMHYNPFSYVHSEKDILKLVTTLMTNTKGEGSGGDPFWEKSERLLLTALIAYLHLQRCWSCPQPALQAVMHMIPVNRKFLRGDIYYANLEPHLGSEQGGIRPVVVVQNNTANCYSPNLIVAPVTSNTAKKPDHQAHVLVDGNRAFLQPSMILAESVQTISKGRLIRPMGRLSIPELIRLNYALLYQLDLNEWVWRKEAYERYLRYHC